MCGVDFSPNSSNQKFCSKCKKINQKEWYQKPAYKIKKKIYRQKNKKKRKEYGQKYLLENKDNPEFKLKRKLIRKKSYWKNKEKENEYGKKYRQENKEKERIRKQKWEEENPNYSKEYYHNNKDKWKGDYQNNKDNPEFKLKKKGYAKDYNNRLDVIRRKSILGKRTYQNNKEAINERHKKRRKELVEEENTRRKKLGLPLVGEGFKAEMELLVYVHKLFGNYDILTHHRKFLMSWKWGLELDIYIPELRLAFEYMGIQHYKFTEFFHTKEDFEAQQYRDRCKKRICKLKGITLIKIKYNEKLSEQLVLSKLKYLPIKTSQEILKNKIW